MSRFSFLLFLALRYLRSKRKEVFISIITVISLLGVAVSVMVLNIVLAVMTGFEEELQSKLIDANAHITVKPLDGRMGDYQIYVDAIEEMPEIKGVFPFTFSQAMVQTEDGAKGVIVRGIADAPSSREKLSKNLPQGFPIERLFSRMLVSIPDGGEGDGHVRDIELPTIILGEELRRRLGVVEGSIVTLVSPELGSSPLGLVPRYRRFVVAGVYSSGLVEYEAGLVYVGVSEAQQFFSLGDTVSGLDLDVFDRNQVQNLATKVRVKLNEVPDLSEALIVSDWTQQNRPLWDAIKLEKRVYFIVLLLLVLVASFSIVTTLVMVVMEKGKDIAVLKTIGVKDSEILIIFLMQGAMIGFGGVILGTVLGYGASLGLKVFGFPIDARVFSLDTVPVYLEWSNFAVVAGVGFLITACAGLYPARRASRIVPSEVLRFE